MIIFKNVQQTHNVITLIASVSKGLEIREPVVFTSPNDIRLKCFKKISDWLQNDWCVSLKDMPENKQATTVVASNNTEEKRIPNNEEYYNALNYFINKNEKKSNWN